MTKSNRRVYEGFKRPAKDPTTAIELGWIDLLRCTSGDADPPTGAQLLQTVRIALHSR